MKTKSASETTVKITRTVRAPIDRVFAAWTDASIVRQWWHGEDSITSDLVLQPRVGGDFRWEFANAQGHKHIVHGEVFELVPREKISFTWTDDEEASSVHHDASRVTVDFREGRGVEIRLVHQRLEDAADRDAHERTWNAALDRLEQMLAGK